MRGSGNLMMAHQRVFGLEPLGHNRMEGLDNYDLGLSGGIAYAAEKIVCDGLLVQSGSELDMEIPLCWA